MLDLGYQVRDNRKNFAPNQCTNVFYSRGSARDIANSVCLYEMNISLILEGQHFEQGKKRMTDVHASCCTRLNDRETRPALH
jgi:hypothetical protein